MVTPMLMYGRRYQKGVNWITAIAMIAFHVLAVAAFFFIDPGAMLAALVLYFVGGMLGIGMAYHRLLTHRGYKTYKWVEYFLTFCGTLALEGGPIFWVATHRIHHQKSDREGDPHTPREGTWWAHMGWILRAKGCTTTRRSWRATRPTCARTRVHVWLSNWHWTSNVVVGLVLLAFGGMPYVLWGIFFRTTFGLHCTWLVNSATHLWGSRRFETRDDSTNNWWVAAAHLRRGLAQQPPRPPDQRPSRPGLVRVRPELDRHQHAARARPGLGHQGRQDQAAGALRRERHARARRRSGSVTRQFRSRNSERRPLAVCDNGVKAPGASRPVRSCTSRCTLHSAFRILNS